jgi:hypothetical protein
VRRGLSLGQEFWIWIVPNHLKGRLLYDASAATTNVQACPVTLDVGHHLVAIRIARKEAFLVGLIAANADPCVFDVSKVLVLLEGYVFHE